MEFITINRKLHIAFLALQLYIKHAKWKHALANIYICVLIHVYFGYVSNRIVESLKSNCSYLFSCPSQRKSSVPSATVEKRVSWVRVSEIVLDPRLVTSPCTSGTAVAALRRTTITMTTDNDFDDNDNNRSPGHHVCG